MILFEILNVKKNSSNGKKQKKLYHKDEDNVPLLSLGYWNGFLHRHKHELRNKPVSGYSIDRANFTNYLNFSDMFDHIEKIMIKSGIARPFPEPVWMSQSGEIVASEDEGYGMKVTIDIHRPDMGLMLDECGCNLSQEGDHCVGGELFLTGLHNKAYESRSTKHNHFTLIGVTLMSGEPLMCVIIITGKNHDVLVEMGLDVTQLLNIDDDDLHNQNLSDFIRSNHGEGNLFPGAPTCVYKDKVIPAYVTFSESGGITATILTNIFRRFDSLEIFDEERSNGIIPFVLLDGHGSRFELKFLEYINHPDHRWNVCLGVPYGTAIWQVADSSQQNGKFKMLFSRAKRELFRSRIETCQQSMHLVQTDIVPLVNQCWDSSFGDIQANRRAISEKGWGPFNCNLLLHSNIRASMTESQIEDEKNKSLFPHNRLSHLHSICYREDSKGKVKLISSNDSELGNINLNGGTMSKSVTDTIVSDRDLQAARQRILLKKEQGTTVQQRLEKIKKRFTSTGMTIEACHYHFDQLVLDHVQGLETKKKDKKIEKRQKNELEYMIKCYKADIAKARNNASDPKKWRSKDDIKAFLQPLKLDSETWLEIKYRNQLEDLYSRWFQRERNNLVLDESVTMKWIAWLNNQKKPQPPKTT